MLPMKNLGTRVLKTRHKHFNNNASRVWGIPARDTHITRDLGTRVLKTRHKHFNNNASDWSYREAKYQRGGCMRVISSKFE